jgi:hypothetical protein
VHSCLLEYGESVAHSLVDHGGTYLHPASIMGSEDNEAVVSGCVSDEILLGYPSSGPGALVVRRPL